MYGGADKPPNTPVSVCHIIILGKINAIRSYKNTMKHTHAPLKVSTFKYAPFIFRPFGVMKDKTGMDRSSVFFPFISGKDLSIIEV